MKKLSDEYRSQSTEELERLLGYFKRRADYYQSTAALIKREIKHRRKNESKE